MNARRLVSRTIVSLFVLLVGTAGFATAAGASKGVVGSFGETGSGAGQFASSSSGVGGVAVNQNGTGGVTAGDVYVVDRGNNRVQEFSATGSFVRTFGLNVGGPAVNVCTAACVAGTASSAAGGLSAPQGVAIDQSNGNVYVTDQGNRRVDVFSATGAFEGAWGWGVIDGVAKFEFCTTTTTCHAPAAAGSGAGQFGTSIGYPAVDPGSRNVYVADSANRRVDEFSVTLNGSQEVTGTAFVSGYGWGVTNGASEFQICTTTCHAPASTGTNTGQFGSSSPTRVAVDKAGYVYAVDGGNSRVQKFDSSGNPVAIFATAQLSGSPAPTDVAVNPVNNHVFVVKPCNLTICPTVTNTSERHVLEFDSGGTLIETDAVNAGIASVNGLAIAYSISGTTGNIYLSSTTGSQRVFILNSPPNPPTATLGIVSPPTLAVTAIIAHEATLHGEVNPNEVNLKGLKALYQFEYSTDKVSWTKAPATAASAGSGTSAVAVSRIVTGLRANTPYYVRLHAEKEFAAGSATSSEEMFTTVQAPPVVVGESVLDVSSDSVTFQAEVNPEGTATTYRVEYDTSEYSSNASHGESVPSPEGSVGAGSGSVTVEVHVQGLSAATVYHYRVVATNSAHETEYAKDQTFTTRMTGSEFALPDNRAYELVSPANKHGAVIGGLSEQAEGGVIETAETGNAITYVTKAPIVEAPASNTIEGSQVISRRVPGAWQTMDLATPHNAPSGVNLGNGAEYQVFSADLSLGLVEPFGETPLSLAVYIRDTGGVSYQPVITNREPFPFRTFDGATSDLSHVVLSSKAPLTATVGSNLYLYEWFGSELQLASVLAGGTAAPEPVLGAKNENVRHAISDNGSRVMWSSEGHLYMRETTEHGKTFQLDAAQGVAEPANGEAVFQTASNTGSKVFFTDGQNLTTDATAGGGGASDLYVFERDKADGSRLSDLTVDHNPGEHAGVLWLLPGSSEDGSYVYFVAKGALAAGASPGGNNLYVAYYDGSKWEQPTFIAGLSSNDSPDWGEPENPEQNPGKLTSRVSSNGRFLTFMSDEKLTSYDNRDANSGVPDEEVYLYDASRPVSANNPRCASCNPTNAQPVGMLFKPSVATQPLVDRYDIWSKRWIAANIPGWTANGFGTARYQSRYLSNDGRLFFNSTDSLTPQDTNGSEDVYQYEPTSVGTCTLSSPTFSTNAGGCVDLISSGSSQDESAFLDASESGDDVFFLTAAKLVPRDIDTSFDIYDAHRCSEASPCITAPASPPPCSTADSCRLGSLPQPSVFGAPPSATFSGAGNFAPPATKSLTRAQKLARALKACHKKKNKRKRVVCERRARKSYGARASRAGKPHTVNASKRGRG